MPSIETYKKLYSGTIGQERKRQSDVVLNATWWSDISSRVVYLFDYYHDNNRSKLNCFDPTIDSDLVPIDAKFITHSTQTYGDDAKTFHLMLRPGQKCNVEYYDDVLGNRYDATFPVGLYALIPDEQGIYNRWLVVDKADYNDAQFPTFEVLRCDYIIRYINKERKPIEIAGVLQSQNSYNSGIWSGQKTTIVENDIKFAVPLNIDTEEIYYNLRMIVDNKLYSKNAEPLTWHVSKVNRIMPNGIVRITLTQTKFNPETDNGMWADYWVGNTPPNKSDEKPTDMIHAEITYAGKPTIRVGSGYKKLSLNFYQNESEIPMMDGQWQYFVGDEDVSSLIVYSSAEIEKNEIKIKFNSKDTSYGGKTLTIKYVVNADIQASVDLDLANL